MHGISHASPKLKTQRAEAVPLGAPSRSYAMKNARVTPKELQVAFLLVVLLFASVALLNLDATVSTLVESWHSFVEFLLVGLA